MLVLSKHSFYEAAKLVSISTPALDKFLGYERLSYLERHKLRERLAEREDVVFKILPWDWNLLVLKFD